MFITKTMTPDASKTLSQRRPSHQHKSHSKNLLNLFKKEFHDKKINGKEYKISKLKNAIEELADGYFHEWEIIDLLHVNTVYARKTDKHQLGKDKSYQSKGKKFICFF